MSPLRALRGWRGPPLAWQILGLLVGGLVVAQLVTLFLTMVLPPEPAPQYKLDDIAAALRGRAAVEGLERRIRSGPPDVSGVGWLRSPRSQGELARLLGAEERDVALAFYTPLPFAGALTGEPRGVGPGLALNLPQGRFLPASYVMLVEDGPSAGGMPGGGSLPGGGAGAMPGGFPSGVAVGGFPGQRPAPGMGSLGGAFPRDRGGGGARSDRAEQTRSERGRLDERMMRDDRGNRLPAGSADRTGDPASRGASIPVGVREGGRATSSEAGAQAPGSTASRDQAGPPRPAGTGSGVGNAPFVSPRGGLRGFSGVNPFLPGLDVPDAPAVVQRMPPSVADDAAPPARPAPVDQPAPNPVITAPSVPAVPLAAAPPRVEERATTDTVSPRPYEVPEAVPLRAPSRGLFGLAPAPFVEGDFVAALRQPDGRWAVVQPEAEPFPTVWQRRLMLWFAVAFAIVGPLGLLFARRLVRPLSGFAEAAEQLGRDPSAAVLPLAGPAEIGRAANAFNVMQSRLRAFVDDRTAMVGAISHDLRTPLTRMRFRIEEVEDDDVRAGMTGEVEEMEAMITSVLDYIRDASTPGVRERLDLRLLVDDVVEDAQLVGSDVAIERAEPAPVEVDVLGMRRVLDNLLGNAIKYGARARVRLRTDADEAVAEIIDDGPGLPDEELERVFEPFYRTPEAVASDKKGSGLGLAVCRSIARAHGGDVRLVRSSEGFLAQVRVPLAYGTERQAA